MDHDHHGPQNRSGDDQDEPLTYRKDDVVRVSSNFDEHEESGDDRESEENEFRHDPRVCHGIHPRALDAPKRCVVLDNAERQQREVDEGDAEHVGGDEEEFRNVRGDDGGTAKFEDLRDQDGPERKDERDDLHKARLASWGIVGKLECDGEDLS